MFNDLFVHSAGFYSCRSVAVSLTSGKLSERTESFGSVRWSSVLPRSTQDTWTGKAEVTVAEWKQHGHPPTPAKN